MERDRNENSMQNSSNILGKKVKKGIVRLTRNKWLVYTN